MNNWLPRFMMVPQKTMEQELKGQEKELTDDINNLNKKVSSGVLRRTSAKNTLFLSRSFWRSSSTMLKPSYVTL